MRRSAQSSCLIMAMAVFPASLAHAFTATISPGPRAIYLQVGNGSFTGVYTSGGTPGNNAAVNVVSLTVPAAQVGNGTSLAMTSNSSAAQSFYDGHTFCTLPGEVYIGGFFRRPGGPGRPASLTVNTPLTLTAAGDSIPFNKISWISSGIGDTGAQPIPSGSFTGGTQTLASFLENTWNESCHRFSYLNDQVVAAGTYIGQATYTLSAP